jgi:c-di-GMP-binding flagellar brake protein YcgR
MPLTATPESDLPELAPYWVHAHADIMAVVRDLVARNALVNLYFAAGSGCSVTRVLAVQPDALIVDAPAAETDTRAALRSPNLTAVAFVDRVKVQFTVEEAERVAFEDGPALRLPLPDAVLRLQRRDFFRVGTPQARPLVLMVPRGDDPARTLRLRLVDISCGGAGVVLPPGADESLEAGRLFRGCTLDLPEYGAIGGSVVVRWVRQSMSATGLPQFRAGIQFLDLARPMVAHLQLYIHRLERERLSRE